jgi:hypothetical protein
METTSLKALAGKVLQGNRRGNQKETKRFPLETSPETFMETQEGNLPPETGTETPGTLKDFDTGFPKPADELTFCYWKAGNVPASECVKPCMAFKDGRTISQCQHFEGHWAG